MLTTKRTFSAPLIAIMVSVLLFVGSSHFGTVKASTTENGILTSDTTWNKADSPYTFSGPVGVATGVTLTINAGVTVNLGLYDLTVNGTLNAQGTTTNNIIFNGANIDLTTENAQGTFENAILKSTSISSDIDTSVEINHCVFEVGAGVNVWSSSAIISNNYITGQVFVRGPAVVSDNTILGGVDAGSFTSITPPSYFSYSYTFLDNNITNPNGAVMDLDGAGTVSGNIISGGSTGINWVESLEAPVMIERNLIINNQYGIRGDSSADADYLTIQNNTIANNYIGINGAFPSKAIIYNNIENNSNCNMESSQLAVNATYNWWGTANSQAISQTIIDSKNNYNLGTVTFVPFLTAPNPQAPPITTPIPTLTPTPAPSSSPSQSPSTSPSPTQSPTASSSTATSPTTLTDFNGLEIAIFATLIVIAVLLIVIVTLLLRKNKK